MVPKLPHYIIVGGGLSGLSTAYFLSLAKPARNGRITVLENSNRWGGWIHSVKSAKTGSIYELGPHSARFSSKTSNLLLRMALDLGFQDSIIWMTRDKDVGRKLLFANGHLKSLSDLVPLSSLVALILERVFSRRPPQQDDWTVDEFLRTRLNADIADNLGSAIMRGIYGGDSRQLSARACLPTLVEAEDLGPNLMLGLLRSMLNLNDKTDPLPAFIDSKFPQVKNIPNEAFAWSLSNGMQSVTDALVKKLGESGSQMELCLNSPVTQIGVSSGRFTVSWQDGSRSRVDEAQAVFLCCPSYKVAELLNGSVRPELLNLISKQSIPWVDIAAVVLELAAPADPPIRGFGHLVPLKDDPETMGIIYDSVALPSQSGASNLARYTVMMKPRPTWLESSVNPSDKILESIQTAACDAITKQLGITNPVVVDRQIFLMRNCIPQYTLGHKKRVSEFRDRIQESSQQGLHFVGYSYDGVGLSDVVRSALDAVTKEVNCK